MFKFVDKFYGRSSSWRKVRAEHIKQNPTCAACGRKEGLEVHHVIPYHIDNTKELDPDNLITLCGKYCHFVFGHLMYWKSWNENVREDAAKYLEKKTHRPFTEVFGDSAKSKNSFLDFIFNLYYDVRWVFYFITSRDD